MLSQSSCLVSLQNNITEKSRLQPLQPPGCNRKGRGVHSSLRSGVEQRSSAYTFWPLGASPLPLSDVGRNKRSTSRRRTRHGHGHTGMDHVASRVRRSRHGAAFLISACASPTCRSSEETSCVSCRLAFKGECRNSSHVCQLYAAFAD